MQLQLRSLLSLFSILLIVSIAQAQGFLNTDGKQIVDENGDDFILRGMGLGGWMLQEGYMLQTAEFANAQFQIRDKIEELIGLDATEVFYDAWLENHVRKADIDSLKSWGFNSVRLPMHYNLFTLPIEDEPQAGQNTWLDKGFELTDQLISWCAENEIYVILDLHAAPGGQGYDQGISDYDTSKPSLWESFANRKKTAALWKQIADRYKNEPWVAGYDLLNEPNWDLPGGNLLRSLYVEITDSIRSVDQDHIIFIEGNWFANDFTGLTPPWDDKLVYSPHKYWSINDQNSIQWVLNLRNNFNVPLYLGESGENSNVWFRDAIKLLEDNGIGWAWWPMKKIEAIAGPLSVTKTDGYEQLLNYWKGGGNAPTAQFATQILMDLTEKLKIENCFYQKDVIDAMFRQVQTDATIPFAENKIPGLIYASNYDLGRAGFAYQDTEDATYHVSTSNYTAWNNGWAYRNDGVDMEICQDTENNNGYNVGWFEEGEWMKYTVNVEQTGVYDILIRAAGGDFGGQFNFSSNGAQISKNYYVPFSGGYQNWQTVIVEDVVLDENDISIEFTNKGFGYNLNSFEFIYKGLPEEILAEFLSAETMSEKTIKMSINKFLATQTADLGELQVLVNGIQRSISQIEVDPNNNRNVIISLIESLKYSDIIKLNYTGPGIEAADGTSLVNFILEDVINNLPLYHSVPGKIEAEDYFTQEGIQLENTSDSGGGENIAYLDPGDYLEYYIDVAQAGSYNVTYRTASETSTGGVRMEIVKENGSTNILHQVSFPQTGGWQTWTTTSEDMFLNPGLHVLRMTITNSPFNMNWFEFSFLTDTEESTDISGIQIFPNPAKNKVSIHSNTNYNLEVSIFNLEGKKLYKSNNSKFINTDFLANGMYFMHFQKENSEEVLIKKLIIQH